MAALTGLSIGMSAEDAFDHHQEMWRLAGRLRPTRIIVDGDSKGKALGQWTIRSPLFHSQMIYPADIMYDQANDNLAEGTSVSSATSNGGDVFAMTSQLRLTRMETRVRFYVGRGETVWIIMKVGTNDSSLNSDNDYNSTVANLDRYWAVAKAAGAAGMIVFSVDPYARASLGDVIRPSQLNLGTSRAIQGWARRNRGEIVYVDNTQALALDTDDGYVAPGIAGGYLCSMVDELHEGAYGGWLQGPQLASVMKQLFPPRPRFASARAGRFAPPTNSRGGIIGGRGRFGGTGAGAGSHDVQGGTLIGGDQYPAGAGGIFARLSGDQTLEVRSVPWPEAVARWGRYDILATDFIVTGTPSSSGFISFGVNVGFPAGFDPTTTPVWIEAVLEMHNLTNMLPPTYSTSSDGIGGLADPQDADIIPVQNGLCNIHNLYPAKIDQAYGIYSSSTRFGWRPGRPTTGSWTAFVTDVYPAIALPFPV